MATYTQQAVDNLIKKFEARQNFNIYTIEGSLLDNYILTADNTKTAIIKEQFLNEWSSAYTIILYNKTPKKYQQVIDFLENEEQEKAEKLFFKK